METCRAVLENGILTLENDRIRRVYAWNEGHLVGRQIVDKSGGRNWDLAGDVPDVDVPGLDVSPTDGDLDTAWQEATAHTPAHLRARVTTHLGDLWVRRRFRIYPGCPAIACDLYLRGKPPLLWTLSSLAGEANGALVRACQPWVVAVAQLFVREGISLSDLVDAGNVALLRALRAFDPMREPSFEQYLWRWIRMGVRQAISGERRIVDPRLDEGEELSDVWSPLDEKIKKRVDAWLEQRPAVTVERLCLSGRHLDLDCVQFYDVTDRRNTLVRRESVLPYRHEGRLTGNLLLVRDPLVGGGLFVLKEAPCSDVQLAGPGYDFMHRTGEIRAAGIGVEPDDLRPDEWTRGYGTVVGVGGGDEYALLSALRTYQEQVRIHTPARDEMILLNTWGDRGQDTRICEGFALDELACAARLGITHFQLDDGWQAGRSSNSAYAGGSLEDIWAQEDYWSPHPERFPGGLGPVVERSRALGIELCLWFNPSKDGSYAHWREDADVLIGLYRQHGIRTFKVDGVMVPDKQADLNLRAMFERVMQATGGEAVFNLDVTAGQIFPIGEQPSGTSWTGFQSIARQGGEGYLLVYRERNDRDSAGLELWDLAGQRLRCECVAGHGADFEGAVDAAGTLRVHLPGPFTFALYQYRVL